jgi:hypothetical protein
VADRALAAAAAWDDWLGAHGAQVVSQRVGILASVRHEASQAARRGGEHVGSGRHVAGVTRGQMDDCGAAEDVGEDVDLGGLAAARRADGLRPGPPLPPWAERWARR